jgi:tetratricopeptide (TPR) repeat protein
MKKMFRVALIGVCSWLCLAFSVNAQMPDQPTYDAYLGDADAAKTDAKWDKAVAEKQIAYDKTPNNTTRWNLALAQFGLLNATMRNRNEDRFDKYYKVTEEHLEVLMKDANLKADASAVLSGLYGLKMGYSSMMGMVLGPKSSSLIEEAKKTGAESPIVWKVYANSKMFTPALFGGDPDEAMKAYEKCVALFEKNTENLKYNWMYLDALVFQGRAYSAQGQTAKAIATYEKVLKVEPNMAWVKFELLPKAKQKALGK